MQKFVHGKKKRRIQGTCVDLFTVQTVHSLIAVCTLSETYHLYILFGFYFSKPPLLSACPHGYGGALLGSITMYFFSFFLHKTNSCHLCPRCKEVPHRGKIIVRLNINEEYIQHKKKLQVVSLFYSFKFSVYPLCLIANNQQQSPNSCHSLLCLWVVSACLTILCA